MGTVNDILFKNYSPPSLLEAVFVMFDMYEGSTLTSTEGVNIVPIMPIKKSWKVNPKWYILGYKFLSA
jgi:hypothetical protein